MSECPSSVAYVQTTNKVKAAPLILNKRTIQTTGKIQAVIANSGIANACTGQKGMEDAISMQQHVSETLGINQDFICVASTGIIGQRLPMSKIKKVFNS